MEKKKYLSKRHVFDVPDGTLVALSPIGDKCRMVYCNDLGFLSLTSVDGNPANAYRVHPSTEVFV